MAEINKTDSSQILGLGKTPAQWVEIMAEREIEISERTLRRMESGDGATVDSLARVLLALKIAQNLDLLVPDPRVRPIERVRTGGTERQRSRSAKSDQPTKQWRWGSPE